jgi:hypothetical protein
VCPPPMMKKNDEQIWIFLAMLFAIMTRLDRLTS